MFHTRIPPEAKARWADHSNAPQGIAPSSPRDHADARRLGAFVRPLDSYEPTPERVPALHQPLVVVRPTCDPHVVKRSYVAAPPNDKTFPDFCDVAGDAGLYVGDAFTARPLSDVDTKASDKWVRQ